jgi:hypothetical protein
MPAPKFLLGHLVATPAALKALDHNHISGIDLINRHLSGDWGDTYPEDAALNDTAITSGNRILSVYKLPLGDTIWIITEADRSATTLLLPEDY